MLWIGIGGKETKKIKLCLIKRTKVILTFLITRMHWRKRIHNEMQINNDEDDNDATI